MGRSSVQAVLPDSYTAHSFIVYSELEQAKIPNKKVSENNSMSPSGCVIQITNSKTKQFYSAGSNIVFGKSRVKIFALRPIILTSPSREIPRYYLKLS
jgi:hypothetical protein